MAENRTGARVEFDEIVAICKQYNVPCGHPHVDSGNVEAVLKKGFRWLMTLYTKPKTLDVIASSLARRDKIGLTRRGTRHFT